MRQVECSHLVRDLISDGYSVPTGSLAGTRPSFSTGVLAVRLLLPTPPSVPLPLPTPPSISPPLLMSHKGSLAVPSEDWDRTLSLFCLS